MFDHNEIRSLLDAEKPAFDYARYLLTFYAWAGLSLVLGREFIRADPLTRVVVGPSVLGAGIFSIFMMIRMNELNENIARILFAKSGGLAAKAAAAIVGLLQVTLLIGVAAAAATIIQK
ncbi:hypothetical protein [Mesorhizobium jarvisii]|uniref:hypothetical protein n=1 Tax=Mesorhizobium jarvisii TaxID=1777867 RepID=UPI001F0A5DEF|nr:hypothetical protein [Mesorhizobium jarvisii]MCH4560328.1 hypothetical protein [Mesorhizobium jarvisii]